MQNLNSLKRIMNRLMSVLKINKFIFIGPTFSFKKIFNNLIPESKSSTESLLTLGH